MVMIIGHWKNFVILGINGNIPISAEKQNMIIPKINS